MISADVLIVMITYIYLTKHYFLRPDFNQTYLALIFITKDYYQRWEYVKRKSHGLWRYRMRKFLHKKYTSFAVVSLYIRGIKINDHDM